MAFQFGTNWSVLAEKTGSIQGPLLGYETFTAFLLEATFLGVVLLGRDRVPPWFYFMACCMLALGTMASSFWILANNSWMQVPVGHKIVDGKIIPSDWLAIVAGPVFLIRWVHMLLAAFLTTAMCVIAAGASYLLRGIHRAEALVMMHWGMGLAAVLIVVQLFFGHLNGKYVYTHQPTKFAAIEARWQRSNPAPRCGSRSRMRRSGATCSRSSSPGSAASSRPELDRAVYGLADLPRDGLAASRDSVLCVPDHGRHGPRDAGDQLVRQLAALARAAGDDALVLVGRVPGIPGRFRRRAQRLVHRRGRAPALGRVGPAAHRRCDHADPTTGAQVLATLIGYIVVYTVIFAFGVLYIYALLRDGPTSAETRLTGATAMRPMAAAGSAETATGGQVIAGR